MEVKLQDALEGAEVAQDVYHGKTLLVQSGTRLTTTIISSLIRRGVESVVLRDQGTGAAVATADDSGDHTRTIAREAAEEMGSRATETLNKAMAKLDQQFAPYAGDPVMMGLKAAAARHWAERAKAMDAAGRAGR